MIDAAQPVATDFDWEAAGRELSGELDRLHSIVVMGADENATARVALGIARHQCKRRPVAIGDLIGDAAEIRALAPSGDPHGLADVLEYGVSMEKVARRVSGEKNLFVLPSGDFVSGTAEILTHRRWTRLAAGFREEEGLLILAVDVNAPHIEALVVQLDGAVLVGHDGPARLPVSRVVGTVRGPDRPRLPEPRTHPRPSRGYMVFTGQSPWRSGAITGIGLALIAAMIVVWLVYRPFARSAWAPLWLRGDTLRGLILPMETPDDSLVATNLHLGLLTQADSVSQVPYGLSLITFNTQAGALLELQRNGASLRAGTFTPVLIRETPWFRVVAGAYPDSAAAAALLDSLRARGMSVAGLVVIDRFPFALQLERGVQDTSVASRVAMYQARGFPAYALLQSDGTARLYAGAFRTKEEAALLTETLRSAGVRASLVYRTGRVY